MKVCKTCGHEGEDQNFRGKVCRCCVNSAQKEYRLKKLANESPEEKELRNLNHAKYIKERMKNPEIYEKVRKQKRDYALSRPEYSLWRRAKDRAKRKCMEFTIKESDIIIPKVCPIFGIEMQLGGDSYNSPSIDRIDSSKGYTLDNIMIISYRANTLKNDATPKEIAMLHNFYSKFIEDI